MGRAREQEGRMERKRDQEKKRKEYKVTGTEREN